jgi:hypothetical protein
MARKKAENQKPTHRAKYGMGNYANKQNIYGKTDLHTFLREAMKHGMTHFQIEPF